VDALRQAVSSGSYEVSDQQLSDAVASDLFGRVIA
jgi:anti-sigma28 factor (negative regulator of flagellin synthesis)